MALIGNEGVSVLEVQRHRGEHGEFGGGHKMVNCKCSLVDPGYFTARRHTGTHIVMHVEWINEDELILLTSDETIREVVFQTPLNSHNIQIQLPYFLK